MSSCKSTYRISKMGTGKRKGRGRPQAYSESWKKKIVILRACGLVPKEILDLLRAQDGAAFKAKDPRRCQQIIQELLTDENEKFKPLDKKTTRTLAAFIRASRPRNNKPPSLGINSSMNALTSPVTDASLLSPSSQSTAFSSQSYSVESSPKVIDHEIDQTLQFDVDMTEPTAYTACSSNNQISHLSSRQNTEATENHVFNQQVFQGTIEIGQQLLAKNGMRANIMRWSKNSHRSSFLSDIASIIGRRFSCSTSGTTDRFSISTSSEPVAGPNSIQDRAKNVLKSRLQADVVENTALIERCCSHASFCLHKAIKELAEAADEFGSIPWNNFLKAYHEPSSMVAPGKTDDALFFAARVGAPANVILYLLERATNSGFVNENGQTWLHYLNPRLLKPRICIGDYHFTSHTVEHFSFFECIMSRIHPSFNIDRIDDHGRHFLFYICSTPTFELRLLQELVQRHPEWAKRVALAAQIRDREGLFLLDCVSTHPEFSELSAEMQLLLRPDILQTNFRKSHPLNLDPLPMLQDEYLAGKPLLHVHVQEIATAVSGASTSIALPRETMRQQINRYDNNGRTPLMVFVEHAYENDKQEDWICANVRQLVQWGANVNARSRNGSTILHLAAKHAAVKLLKLLLGELGARLDIRDDNGHTAADHIAEAIKAAHNAKHTAALLARSIKAAGAFLSFQSSQNVATSTPSATIGFSSAEIDAHVQGILLGFSPPVATESHPVATDSHPTSSFHAM